MNKKQKPYFIAIIVLLIVMVLTTAGLNVTRVVPFFVDIWDAIKALFGYGSEEVAAAPAMLEFVASKFPRIH